MLKVQVCDRLVDFTLSTAKTREMPYFKSFTSNINVVLKICRPVSKSLWRGYHSIMSSSMFVKRKKNNLKPAIKGPRDGDAFWILVLEKITEMNKIFWSWKSYWCESKIHARRDSPHWERDETRKLSWFFPLQMLHWSNLTLFLQMLHSTNVSLILNKETLKQIFSLVGDDLFQLFKSIALSQLFHQWLDRLLEPFLNHGNCYKIFMVFI